MKNLKSARRAANTDRWL